ncbi:MAG: PhoH family protein [Defluviitaleaceae bacterium]|nr:PhoH family protein [Defluviitaleaceae bacterium]
MNRQEKLPAIQSSLLPNVFGSLDENIKRIENAFSVKIVNRDDGVQIIGENANKAGEVMKKLVSIAEKGIEITEQNVTYLIQSLGDEGFSDVEKINDDTICLAMNGRPIRPKTIGQKKYIDQIRKNTVVFGIGPAGTGKTFLAMAMAITAFKNGEIQRIILTRPAIEAGEKLGFLPGDLQQKVDPYLRPLYDALHEIMGSEAFLRNMERGLIEVAPLAYMRGRTLDNSFIVLDEAQNTTPEQMKMFLTRMGFGSKVVITGDITQIDLPDGKKSGLNDAAHLLRDIEGIGITRLTEKDVVRHPLVQKIVVAYEKQRASEEHRKTRLIRHKSTKS